MGIHYGKADFINYGKPSLLLDFARNKSLVDRISGNNLITFARASTGTYVGADGLIKTAAADEARFDYDPETGESLGLLIEESRTNLFTNSQLFNFNWTNIRSSESGTTATADPEGFTTGAAFKLVANTDNNTHRLDKTGLSMSVSTTYTMSLWAKAAEYTGVSLTIANSSNLFAGIYFDLSNGTFTNGGDAHSGSMIEYPNGWYRCIATYTTPSSISFQQCLIGVLEDGATKSYTGDNSSGIYIWGAQLEQASFPTSYIPTSASAVTRQPDNAQITGTNFSSWYNQSEGSFYSDMKLNPSFPVSGKASISFTLSDKSFNNRITLASSTGSSALNADVTISGTVYRAVIGNYTSGSSSIRTSIGYKSADTAGSFDGASPVTSSPSGTLPLLTRADIGKDHTNSNYLSGHIRRITYYPQRLTNTQLQELTAQ